MKDLIRKWLDIPDKEEILNSIRSINAKEVVIETKDINSDQIKEMIEDAIFEAFLPQPDVFLIASEARTRFFSNKEKHKDLRGAVENHVRKMAKEISRIEAQLRISELTGQEVFLDQIIARIKNKQL